MRRRLAIWFWTSKERAGFKAIESVSHQHTAEILELEHTTNRRGKLFKDVTGKKKKSMPLQIERTCCASRKFDAGHLKQKQLATQRHTLVQVLEFRDKEWAFQASRKNKQITEEGDRGWPQHISVVEGNKPMSTFSEGKCDSRKSDMTKMLFKNKGTGRYS